MKSNYKPIGRYVRLVKLRNKDLAITDLKGINIDKQFMPSVANVTGTDLSKYKIVSQFQFAFNPMHVGRDEVLPISMLTSENPVIVSPAYTVFEIKNHQELLPEYLMMWCQRSEFDRNAWFTTDSSVRGGFSWEDFCEMPIPVPSIEKQKEIVHEYNTIVERIKLNEQLCQKLEETAQALYKQWFVDFEFPISKEYAESMGKPELEGKPYQSSGGEMVYCKRLDNKIPTLFIEKSLGSLMTINYGKALPEEKRVNGTIPVYSSAGFLGYHDYCLCDTSSVVIGRKGSIGKVYFVSTPSFCIDTAYFISNKDTALPLVYVYILMNNLNLSSMNEDSAVPGLNRNSIYEKIIALPSEEYLKLFENNIMKLLNSFFGKNKSEFIYDTLKNIILKKMSAVKK